MSNRSLSYIGASAMIVAAVAAVALLSPATRAPGTDKRAAQESDRLSPGAFKVTEDTGVLDMTERLEGGLEMVSVLPFDAIRSIDEPRFTSVAEADSFFDDDELVLGISLNGEHHAYSVPMLSSREVVNDVVGGIPVAVTW